MHLGLSRPAAVVCSLFAALATTAFAQTDAEIAARWAPVHYQDTDSDSPESDYLATFSFDGNWDGRDNWDNLGDRSPVQGAVYYSVAETCTHQFITYGFYHPRDWSDGATSDLWSEEDQWGYVVDEGDEHENDMEEAIVAVRKSEGAPGTLAAVLTQAHGGYHSWVPHGSSLAATSVHPIYGLIPQAEYPVGSGQLHPETAQQAKGHGLGARNSFSNFGGESDRDGVIYYPTGVAEAPLSGNDRSVGYGLESFLAAGGLWERQMQEVLQPLDQRQTYYRWGRMRGDESGGCGDGLFVICGENSAGFPWDQDDEREPAPRGAAALDPADLVQAYFVGFDDYGLDYVSNDFITSLLAHGYGPQSDGSILEPATYLGPTLTAEFFAKVVGADGDADGVHSCQERSDGTDPRSGDTDGDGVTDGIDALPLDPAESLDTDSDGIGNNGDTDDDGDTVPDSSDAFPLDVNEWADFDGDHIGDNADTDDDNDRLADALEATSGSNPFDADSDDDGLPDGTDVEFIQNAVAALAPDAFKSPNTATRNSFLGRLEEIEGLLLRGNPKTALNKLLDLRARVDGCGSRADSNDWIAECSAQVDVRSRIDVLVANLEG
jgi:hypothetical protein